MDIVLLIAQILTTAFLAGWLTIGVADNIIHPKLNETYTAEVLSMERMREDYPDHFEVVAGRAIHDRRVQKLLFGLVVSAELVATLILWAGVVALVLALFGTGTLDVARAIALAGALAFTSVWASFLVVGNYYCYWYGHEGGQNTHFQMTLWGIGTMVLLAS